MKQVKAAVGENDAAAVAFLPAKPQNRLLKCQDSRIQRISPGTKKETRVRQLETLVYHAQEARRP
jgi:hypothetical protein